MNDTDVTMTFVIRCDVPASWAAEGANFVLRQIEKRIENSDEVYVSQSYEIANA